MKKADEYAGSLPGVALDVVRTGRGFGPNVAKTHVDENVALAFAVVQFPVMGRTTICDYTIIVALVTSVPSPSRWSGIDVRPNTMLLYGPSADYTATSAAGLGYCTLSDTGTHSGSRAYVVKPGTQSHPASES
jgi:hypothetical protein